MQQIRKRLFKMKKTMLKFKLILYFLIIGIGCLKSAEKELPYTAVILAFDSKLSIDLPARTTKNGARISVWKYVKGENQIWRIKKHDKGYIISSFFSRQVLTANIKDSIVIQEPYSDDEFQYWDIVSENDSYRFCNIASKLYITFEKKPSSLLQLSHNAEGNSQKWYIMDSNNDKIKDLIYGSFIEILKSGGGYDNSEEASEVFYSYQGKDNANLRILRDKYNLDSIAGTGNEILRIINVMHWLHNLVPHDGSNGIPEIRNTIEMIKYGMNNSQGINCRGLAMTLNECYLALGFKSRFVTCSPKDSLGIDDDCHVINSVYSETLKKWIWIDPTNDAYVMDEKGELQSIEEVREKIISGEPLILNPDANWNNRLSQTKDHYIYHYMAKNLYFLRCSKNYRYNLETLEEGKEISYIYLLPKGCNESLKKTENVYSGTKFISIKTHNANVFWEHQE